MHDSQPARIAADFLDVWDSGSTDQISERLADNLIVGDADHTSMVPREMLLAGISKRAALLAATASDAPAPAASRTHVATQPLGDARLLVSAEWLLRLAPGSDLPLRSDFLLDLTVSPPECVAYLARQTLGVGN